MKKWILLCGLCTLSFPALYAQHLDMQSSTDAGGPALFGFSNTLFFFTMINCVCDLYINNPFCRRDLRGGLSL